MSEDTPAYMADLYRPREVWQDAWVRCSGIKIEFRIGWENGIAMLCRMLQRAGYPDGDMLLTEVGVKNSPEGIRQYFESIYKQAQQSIHDTPVPSLISAVLYKALCQISNGAPWKNSQYKTALLAREFVDDDGRLLPAGKEAVTAFEATEMSAANSAIVSPGQKDALRILIQGGKTDDFHGRTINSMIREGWVEYNGDKLVATLRGEFIYKAATAPEPEPDDKPLTKSQYDSLKSLNWDSLHIRTKSYFERRKLVDANHNLTDKARMAMSEYETIAATPKAPQVEHQETAPPQINKHQLSALETAAKKPYKWLLIHGKIRKSLINRGLVTENDNVPKITPAGREMLSSVLGG